MFKIYNSKQKARLCCYDRNKKPPSQRKNIGITQPLLIRRSRQEEIKKKNNKVYLENTVNKFYNSGGYGRSCSNRKQIVFTDDKMTLKNTTVQAFKDKEREERKLNCSKYCRGYMTKYQAKLQANVGASDRLSRMKALAIRGSSSSNFRFTYLPKNYEFDICTLTDYLATLVPPLTVKTSKFNDIVEALIDNKLFIKPQVSDSCIGNTIQQSDIKSNIPDKTFSELVTTGDRIKQSIKINWTATNTVVRKGNTVGQTLNHCQLFTLNFSQIKEAWSRKPDEEIDISYQENWKFIYNEVKVGGVSYVIKKVISTTGDWYNYERKEAEKIGYTVLPDNEDLTLLATPIINDSNIKAGDNIYFFTESSFKPAGGAPLFPVDPKKAGIDVFIVFKNPNNKKVEPLPPKISFNCFFTEQISPKLDFDITTCTQTFTPANGWSFKTYLEPVDEYIIDKPDLKYVAVKRWTYTDIFGRKFHTEQRLFVRDSEAPVFKEGQADREITDVEYFREDKKWRETKKPLYVDKFWNPETCLEDEEPIEPEWISDGALTYDPVSKKYKLSQRWLAEDEEANIRQEDKDLIINDISAPVFEAELPVLHFDTNDDLTDETKFPKPAVSDKMDTETGFATTLAAINQKVAVKNGKFDVGLSVNAPGVSHVISLPRVTMSNSINNNDSLPEWSPTEEKYKFIRYWKATDQAGNWRTLPQIYYVKDLDCPQIVGADVDYQTSDPSKLIVRNGKFVGAISEDAHKPTITSAFNLDPSKTWPQKFPDTTMLFDSDTKRYVFERLWWARDEQGNVSVYAQNIRIEDVTPPQFVDFPKHKKVSHLVELDPFKNPSIGCPKGTDDIDTNPTISYEDKVIDLDNTNQAINIERTWKVTNETGLETVRVQKIQVFEMESLDLNNDGKDELMVTEEILGLATGYHREVYAKDTEREIVFELSHQDQDGAIEYSTTEKKLYGCFTNINKENIPENITFEFKDNAVPVVITIKSINNADVIFDDNCQFKFEMEVPDNSVSVDIVFEVFTDDVSPAKSAVPKITKDLVKVDSYKTTVISYVDQDLNQELAEDEIVIDSFETFGEDTNNDGVLTGAEIANPPGVVYRTNRPVVTIVSKNPVVEAGTTPFDLVTTNYVTAKDNGGDGVSITPAVIAKSGFDIDKPGKYKITYAAVNAGGYVSDPKSLNIEVIRYTLDVIDDVPATNNVEINSALGWVEAGVGVTVNSEAQEIYSASGKRDSRFEVIITGTVDKTILGDYTITYKVQDTRNLTIIQTVTRTVTVVDTSAPVITLVGWPKTIDSTRAAIFDLLDATHVTVTDNSGVKYAGEITLSVDNGGLDINDSTENIFYVTDILVPGDYTITYTAVDSSGNTATETTTITVVDNTKPIFVKCDDETVAFGDLQFTLINTNVEVTDNSGDAQIQVTKITKPDGTLMADVNDFSIKDDLGDYVIEYTATDAAGNSETATRTVTIVQYLLEAEDIKVLIDKTDGATFNDPGVILNGSTITGDGAGYQYITSYNPGPVDISTAFEYTATYSVKNIANPAIFESISRKIIVRDIRVKGNSEVILSKGDFLASTNPINDSGLIIDGGDQSDSMESVSVTVVDGNGKDYGVNPSGEICSTSREFTMLYKVDEFTLSRKFTVRPHARRKATATAIIERGISRIDVTNGGTNYNPATASVVIDAPGPNVIAEGIFDFSSPMNPRVIITNPGFGYTAKPRVVIDIPGGNKWTSIQKTLFNLIANVANIGNKISENLVVEKGRIKEMDDSSWIQQDEYKIIIDALRFITTTVPIGKKFFAVYMYPPPGTDHTITGATLDPNYTFEDGRAKATLNIDMNGVIQSIDISDAGYGYTTAPNITITGGDGKAAATAVMAGNVITGIKVDSIEAQNNYGYKNIVPGVNIVDTGTGTGAIARAVVEGEQVTSIIVEDSGENYNSATTTVEITGVESDDTSDRSLWLGLDDPGEDYQSKYYLSYTVRDAAGLEQTINLTLNVVYFCLELKEPQIPELTVYDVWNDPGITVDGKDSDNLSDVYSYTASTPRMWKAESEQIKYTVQQKNWPYVTEIEREVRKNYKLAWYDVAEHEIQVNNLSNTADDSAKCIQYIIEDNNSDLISSFTFDSEYIDYTDTMNWLKGNSTPVARDLSNFDIDLNDWKDNGYQLPNSTRIAFYNEIETILSKDPFGEFEEKLNDYLKNKGVDITKLGFDPRVELLNIILGFDPAAPTTVNRPNTQNNIKIKIKIFTTKAARTIDKDATYVHENLVIKGEDDSNVYTVDRPAVNTSLSGEQVVTYTVTKNDDEDIESSIERTINVT